ncbi:hypothetical protein CERSUDRAFT_70843 [Gelatoporia subvermispora B]|uniref:Velvet domain-containing protein n=1 Tax=Ceriporiopsis subvermispora (strain B) TaxID=914234 RepID=M2RPX1_CERS8|nr:hypothetical protein CERSUDRAFT_70843 [Gelatoporia subvermispora B]
MTPTAPGYAAQGYPFPQQQGPLPDSSSFTPISPYGPPPESHGSNWGYPPSTPGMERVASYGPPALPSIQPVNRNPSASGSTGGPGFGPSTQSGAGPGESWPMEGSGRDQSESMSYRPPWPQDAPYTPIDSSAMPPPPPGGVESPVRLQPAPSSGQDLRDAQQYSPVAPSSTTESYPPARYSQEPYTPVPAQSSAPQVDTSMYASASYAQQQHHQAQSQQHYQQGSYVQEPTSPSTIPPLPRHTYTRTLVGPLCSNACRLLDEHRKPGIFFLFQDLSIRTEGTFRLRLRLMNVGA